MTHFSTPLIFFFVDGWSSDKKRKLRYTVPWTPFRPRWWHRIILVIVEKQSKDLIGHVIPAEAFVKHWIIVQDGEL